MTRSSLSLILGHSASCIIAVPAPVSHVRADHLIGAVASLSLIVGAAWLGELTKGSRAIAPVATESLRPLIEMPWLQPDTPEVVEPDAARTPTDLRPPVQADIPSPGRPDGFVQPFEPPPPEGLGSNGGMLTIPVGPSRANDLSKIFDLSQLDRQPVPISQTRPNYPFEMRRNGISGSVEMDFIVDTAGHVTGAFAASSSNREFESPAISALTKWRFQPGRKGGHAVKTHMRIPIVFTLNSES